ncbi:MAG: hypothetical protein KJT01_01730 [Gemmatimonadetes bacterium]|nr:hypothetical protein [Gemmatimonadota bacterium]
MRDGAPLLHGLEPSPVRPGRRAAVLASLLAGAVAVVVRAAQLQVVEHEQWTRLALRQHVTERAVRPLRGAIEDATGTVLAQSRDLVRLSIDPRVLRADAGRRRGAADSVPDHRTRVGNGLRALAIDEALVRRALDTLQRPVVLPRLFLPSDAERFAGIPGVMRFPEVRRTFTASPGLRGVIGGVNGAGVGVTGLELELDPLLRGTAGIDTLVVAVNDGAVTSPEFHGADARPGLTARLTINSALQDIVERALADALARTGATGGDVVVLDPADGAILALVGVRSGGAEGGSHPLADAYEPGSVMKPFVVARLLELGRTTPGEIINTENGRLEEPGRRSGPLMDEHKAPQMTVTDILRLSSNVGIAKLVRRLSAREEYEALRDFGFGMPVGVPHPADAAGVLPRPPYRSPTPTQLGIGYALQATPLQLAAAYASIANGGELLQPVLVRAWLDGQGRVVQAHGRTVIRRVMSPATARAIRGMLESVVDSGTSRAAALATFTVAGKSGTAKRAERGRYVPGGYNATFVGLFPSQDPQVVVLARLVDPKGSIFGGTVAGGLVNDLLQRALASRDAGMDRGRLAVFARAPQARGGAPVPMESAPTVARMDGTEADAPSPAVPPVVPPPVPARIVVRLPLQPSAPAAPGVARAPVAVPDVEGLDARQAARVLVQAGFAVRVARGPDVGASVRTRPEAGVLRPAGALITLEVPP